MNEVSDENRPIFIWIPSKWGRRTGMSLNKYTHFFISTWTFWQKPSLSAYCAYFFRQKPSFAMCLIFLKKSLHVLIQPSELHWKKALFGPNCACDVLLFFDKSLHVLCAYFFWKKAFVCLFSQVNYMLKPLYASSCAFFRQKPSCPMCLIFSKKSLHVLNWPCAYKKWV